MFSSNGSLCRALLPSQPHPCDYNLQATTTCVFSRRERPPFFAVRNSHCCYSTVAFAKLWQTSVQLSGPLVRPPQTHNGRSLVVDCTVYEQVVPSDLNFLASNLRGSKPAESNGFGRCSCGLVVLVLFPLNLDG